MYDLLKGFLKKVFPNKYEKDIKEIEPIIFQINEEFSKLSNLSNDDLRNKTLEFKRKIAAATKEQQDKIDDLKNQIDKNYDMDIDQKESMYKEIETLEKSVGETIKETLNEILPQAFAVVKETARRFKENSEIEVTATEFDKQLATKKNNVEIKGNSAIWKNNWTAAGNDVTWDMVHYDVQLIGGVVLHQGKIAEMGTGEGKTLVGTLPIYLNALSGRGVHVVTVNDYLAKRDSEWMGVLFEFHQLTVDCIDKHQPNSQQRKNAYLADITYGTNNEFGFDYLRDNMANSLDELVQRKHNFAIVDEVDSVLIDDARTPLIISGPTPKGDQHQFSELRPKVEKLVSAQRTYINTVLADAKKLLNSTPENTPDKKQLEKNLEDGGVALLRAYRGLPKNKALIKFLSEPGIRAILQKTENYHMQDNNKEMPKVDKELFFVIDEKNNSIDLTEKGHDLMTDTLEDSNFFVLPDIGIKMTEIEKAVSDPTERIIKKEELIRDYSIKSERIHTVNQLLRAYSLFEKDVEYVIIDNKIKIVDEQTGRVMEGRRYSDGLHQAIEAKENVKIEAVTQTYATITLQNYFRMYAKLAGMTGTAETEAQEFWQIYKLDVTAIPTNRPIARKDSEDFVYKTKREKYNAVIEEIVKLTEAGRPVLVGTTSVEVSELLSRMLKLRNIKHNVLNAKLHQKEADIVAEAGKTGTVTIATNMAGRGTDIKLGAGVKEAGGLAIIGTERHESRRVDRQLRGRAGRQGDPGSSQFFVSLEDDLMRLFGSERIAKLMDRMGIEEGEVIQAGMITKSIERAQKKVEENNFGVRKRLLEYDDVMNSQREVIYSKRRNALYGDKLSIDLANAIFDVCSSITEEALEARDYDTYNMELLTYLGIEPPVSQEQFLSGSLDDITQKAYAKAAEHYKTKTALIAKSAFPVVSDIFKNHAVNFRNVVVPFSDGNKTMQVVANLEKAVESEGRELVKSMEKSTTLAIIDLAWKEHLRDLDDLRQSVQGAVYEQKDPLLIYKFESFEIFKQMLVKVNKDISAFLFRAAIPVKEQAVREAKEEPKKPAPSLKTSRTEIPTYSSSSSSGGEEGNEPRQKAQPVKVDKKVGRNDLCPCGSGKKFKQCHGKGTENEE